MAKFLDENRTEINMIKERGSLVDGNFFSAYPNLKKVSFRGIPIYTFPQSLFSLKNLEYIDLSNTSLDYIPIEFGLMPNLKTIIINLMDTLVEPFYSWVKNHSLLKNIQLLAKNEQFPLQFSFSNTGDLTLFSLNVLSQSAIQGHLYPIASEQSLSFEHRLLLLRNLLNSIYADIFCFQEVQKCVFDNQLTQDFDSRGFDGVCALRGRAKRRSQSSLPFVYGQAIFWRRSKFRLLNQISLEVRCDPIIQEDAHCARLVKFDDVANIVVLQSDTFPLVVVNVHPLYFPELEYVREKFLTVIMTRAQEIAPPGSNFLFCGDFNTTPGSASLEVLINAGYKSLYPTLGQPEPPSMYMATSIKRADHIFFGGPNLTPVGCLPVMSQDEARTHFVFLPTNGFPSDHLPVGGVFNYI